MAIGASLTSDSFPTKTKEKRGKGGLPAVVRSSLGSVFLIIIANM